MKKIIWIDVGTHLAQEYNSVFKGNSWFFIKIIRTILSCIVRRNYFIGFKTIYSIYILRKKLQKYKSNFRVAFIEANSLHFRRKEYYLADDTFCLALADKSSDDFKIGLLYFANSDSKSQGNSIYTSKSNISESDFLLTSIVSAEAFTKSYKICQSVRLKCIHTKTHENFKIGASSCRLGAKSLVFFFKILVLASFVKASLRSRVVWCYTVTVYVLVCIYTAVDAVSYNSMSCRSGMMRSDFRKNRVQCSTRTAQNVFVLYFESNGEEIIL